MHQKSNNLQSFITIWSSGFQVIVLDEWMDWGRSMFLPQFHVKEMKTPTPELVEKRRADIEQNSQTFLSIDNVQ